VFADDKPFIVTSSGWKQSISEVGDFYLRLNADDIHEQHYEEVVKEHIASLGESIGGEGNPLYVGLRGFSSEHTQVIEDGIIQRDLSSPSGVLPLSELFSTPLDQVEVLYGSHTSRWGGGALGGVIHFVSSERVGYGSYQTIKLGALKSIYENNKHHLSLQGSFQNSEGFSVADGGAENDGFSNYGFRALYSLTSDKSKLRVASSFFYRQQDLDAFGGVSGDLKDYTVDTTRYKLVASFQKKKNARSSIYFF